MPNEYQEALLADIGDSVLSYINIYPRSTDDRVASTLQIHEGTVCKARVRLARKGLIKKEGRRRNSRGNTAMSWSITDAGLNRLRELQNV